MLQTFATLNPLTPLFPYALGDFLADPVTVSSFLFHMCSRASVLVEVAAPVTQPKLLGELYLSLDPSQRA